MLEAMLTEALSKKQSGLACEYQSILPGVRDATGMVLPLVRAEKVRDGWCAEAPSDRRTRATAAAQLD